MTNNDIALKANEVLEKYLTKGNCHKILQDIIVKEEIKYKVVNSKNDNFIGAFTKGINGQLYIMTNSNIENTGRINFTIAHELGHHFLNHQLKQNSFYCSNEEIIEEGENENNIEQEANHFATCLLMPEQKIKPAFLNMLANSKRARVKDFLCVKNDYTYSIWAGIKDNLTRRYGVSEAALRYRLTKLGLARFEFDK